MGDENLVEKILSTLNSIEGLKTSEINRTVSNGIKVKDIEIEYELGFRKSFPFFWYKADLTKIKDELSQNSIPVRIFRESALNQGGILSYDRSSEKYVVFIREPRGVPSVAMNCNW